VTAFLIRSTAVPVQPLEQIVNINVDSQGMNDIYINDLVSLTMEVEGSDNIIQCNRAPLLMFNMCSQPLDDNEPIPREMMEARNKLESKALLEETKTILGWLINF
jgi:hypothetical protein